MHCPLLWKFCMEVTSYFVKQYCRRISWKVSEVMIYFMGLRWKGQLSIEDYLPWWFLVLANSLRGALRDLELFQQICIGQRDAPFVEQGSLRLCRAAEMSPALWCMYIQPLLFHPTEMHIVAGPLLSLCTVCLRRLIPCLYFPVFSCNIPCHLRLFKNSSSASSILQRAGTGLTDAILLPTYYLPYLPLLWIASHWSGALSYSFPVESLSSAYCQQCLESRGGVECFNSLPNFPLAVSYCVLYLGFPPFSTYLFTKRGSQKKPTKN